MVETLAQRIYGVVVERLLTGKLVPGVFVDRKTLAKEMGVSIGPVSVALGRLAAEGFLQSLGRKGTLVKPIRELDVLGTLIVREGLECQIARLICGDTVRRSKKKLLKLAEETDAQPVGSIDQWKLEIEFHKALAALTGCEVLEKEHSRAVLLSALHSLNLIIVNYGKAGPGDHNTRLLRALIEADPEKADRAMRQHIRFGKGPFTERMPKVL